MPLLGTVSEISLLAIAKWPGKFVSCTTFLRDDDVYHRIKNLVHTTRFFYTCKITSIIMDSAPGLFLKNLNYCNEAGRGQAVDLYLGRTSPNLDSIPSKVASASR